MRVASVSSARHPSAISCASDLPSASSCSGPHGNPHALSACVPATAPLCICLPLTDNPESSKPVAERRLPTGDCTSMRHAGH